MEPHIANAQSRRRPRWESRSTSSLTFLYLAVVQIGLIVVLAVLVRISAQNNGIIDLAYTTAGTGSYTWAVPLLWTSVPPFGFGLFALTWTSMAHSMRDRQPYADLGRPQGTTIGRALLLDYRTVFGPVQWISAARHGHFQVGAALLTAAILSLVVPPLSARLLTDQLVSTNYPVAFRILSKYNESVLNRNDFENDAGSIIDWAPVINAATAVGLFNASNTPWTDSNHAYQGFSLEALGNDTNAVAYGNVAARSAHLDCMEIKDYVLEEAGEAFKISAADRGCPFVTHIGSFDGYALMFTTTAESGCTIAAGASRLVFVALRQPNNNKNNNNQTGLREDMTVISCISGYSETRGILGVQRKRDAASSGGPEPEILSFKPAEEPRVTFGANATGWHYEESNMLKVQSFSPTGRWSTSEFGRLVLYHAVSRNTTAGSLVDPRITVATPTVGQLLDSIQAMFRLVHIILVSSVMMVPVPAPAEQTAATVTAMRTTGEIHGQVLRLVVVPWVACTIAAVLGVCLVCTVWMWLYVRTHRTVLAEEPRGLLSHLQILYPTLQSGPLATGLLRILDDYQASDPGGVSFAEWINTRWNIDEATCTASSVDHRGVVLTISGLGLKGREAETQAERMLGSK
ncbi:hypothetical protein B0H63DRAFT_466150 [Podospora didyma]|uniref:Uncharacterized protein n=1 Tax=Podospora didyma TaxID=330526 RepID=A0AAE0U4Y0_9PEZI|nr:hypothetical protein B0H63DRAFT_466150 [Podospora didyma]